MIKGLLSYLKSLKLFGIGFGISCFILLGSSVNASSYHQLVGFDSYPSVVDSNFEITALRGGAGITNKLGLSKGMFGFRESRLFWWDSNGKPYFYIGNNTQGNAQKYALCDYLSMTGVVSNCTYYSIGGDYYTVFQNFFNNINAGDVFFYNVDSSSSSTTTMQLCWSSQSLNKSMCFNYSNGLTGSRGYTGLTFSNISTSLLGYAPGQGQYNGGGNYSGSLEGSIEGGFDFSTTGDSVNLYCTMREIFTLLESAGYSKYLCYGGIDNFDDYDPTVNYNVIPGTGKTLGDIWGYSASRAWDNFDEWFRFWNGLYIDENNNYNAMWSSYPAVYHTWFDMYYNYGGNYLVPRTIFEYCEVKTSPTFNLDVVYDSPSGYFRSVCDSIIDRKQNGTWDGSYYTSGDEQLNNGNGVGTNWNGVGNLTGITEQKTAVNFIQDFFNKAKSVIPTNYTGTGGGFLPSYIILFLLALILFRFLSH